MLLGGRFVNWGTRDTDSLGVELLCLPGEILEQVTLVLGQQELLCLLDNLPNIGNEGMAFRGELGRRIRERLRLQEAVQCNVDLVILVQKS